MAWKLNPLGNRVLIKRIEESEQRTPGGIIIPDTAKEKPTQGVVIACGPGKLTEDGKNVPMNVKVGDRVLFAKWGGTEIKLDGEEYLILKEEDIYGILKEEE